MGHRVDSHRGHRPEALAAQGERSRCAPGGVRGWRAEPGPRPHLAPVLPAWPRFSPRFRPSSSQRQWSQRRPHRRCAATASGRAESPRLARGEAAGTVRGVLAPPRGPPAAPIPRPAASLPSGLGASRSCRGPSGRGRRGCGLPGLCGAPARPLGLRAFRGRPRHPAPRGGAPPPPVGRPELLLALRRRARLPTGRASLSRGMLRTCRILLCPLCPFIHIYESRREGLLSIRSRGPSSAVGTTSPLAPQAPWELLRRGPCI